MACVGMILAVFKVQDDNVVVAYRRHGMQILNLY